MVAADDDGRSINVTTTPAPFARNASAARRGAVARTSNVIDKSVFDNRRIVSDHGSNMTRLACMTRLILNIKG
jgi:hypothetical protein